MRWMEYLFKLSAEFGDRFQLVTWFSDIDFLPARVQSGCFLESCQELEQSSEDAKYCHATQIFRDAAAASGQPAWVGEASLKTFGNMGLRTHGRNSQLKPLLGALWHSRCASCSAQQHSLAPTNSSGVGAVVPAVMPFVAAVFAAAFAFV